jgi:hypothetical protein
MMGEDREFEGAKTFVRLAADTVNRAAQARGGDPLVVAQAAATAAARQHAPGLLAKPGAQQGCGPQGGFGGGQRMAGNRGGLGNGGGLGGGMAGGNGGAGASGRWARQGRKIILYGA